MSADNQSQIKPWSTLQVLIWVWTGCWAVFTVLIGVGPDDAARNIAGWLRLIGLDTLADYIATNPTVTLPTPPQAFTQTDISVLLLVALGAFAIGIAMIVAKRASK